jgi:hypothetical protein
VRFTVALTVSLTVSFTFKDAAYKALSIKRRRIIKKVLQKEGYLVRVPQECVAAIVASFSFASSLAELNKNHLRCSTSRNACQAFL